MSFDQILILCILAATAGMFMWGRWRHDMVAGAALLLCVVTGLVAADQAFAGFGHPAVITVAAILVLSRGLQTSGAVAALSRRLLPASAGPVMSIAALTGLGAVLSAFMNNVGALALLMPVAIQIARKHELPPGRLLMPIAFGSILGGMVTLIGTPPNLIVSGFRAQTDDGAFGMFDFAPVGLAVAGTCVLFIIAVGWRLVPARQNAASQSFDTGAYLTEARVQEDSKAVGSTLREIEVVLAEHDAQVVGLVRNEVRVHAPSPFRHVQQGDILVIEAEAGTLANALSSLGLKLEEDKPAPPDDSEKAEEAAQAQAEAEESEESGAGTGDVERGRNDAADPSAQDATAPAASGADPAADPVAGDGTDDEEEDKDEDERSERRDRDIVLQEIAVLPGSSLIGRSASQLLLRTRHSINLLAISREGRRSMKRLRSQTLRAGDVLLMQGAPESIAEFASAFGGVPLAERELRIPNRRRAIVASLIMVASIGLAASGLLPAAVCFAIGVVLSMAVGTVPPREVYTAIDWPVIVLLAALIPVAGAMEATGTADLIARFLLDSVAQGHPIVALGLVLLVTMTLSDLMNNAATAAVMCPVALGTADAVGASADPFLMAVAVGASCAFLTPIGHQNNTLILGPGGFRFGDYWRLGVPVQLLVIAVSMPMLLWMWPL